MSYTEIAKTAWEAVDEIKQSPIYKELVAAQTALDTNPQLVLACRSFSLGQTTV
ncbi:MAG: hypothetical protein MZU97_23920 [Bacillus subtilis]|nr:hypothetical protein [Bacillus subtilis]